MDLEVPYFQINPYPILVLGSLQIGAGGPVWQPLGNDGNQQTYDYCHVQRVSKQKN